MKHSLLILVLTALAAGMASADFLDEFNSTTLDPGWQINGEDATHWSLTARSGFMRIKTQYFNGDNMKNWFGHFDWISGMGSFEVRTKLIAHIDSTGQMAAIWTLPDTGFTGKPPAIVGLANAFSSKTVFGIVNDSMAALPYLDSLVYLRIRAAGDTFWTEFSPNDTTWTTLNSGVSRPITGPAMSGLMAFNTTDAGATLQTPSTNADYDWFYTATVQAVDDNPNAKSKLQNVKLKITPNPFAGFAKVPGHETELFAVYDASGAKVGTYNGNRIGEGLVPGVYFIRGTSLSSTPLKVVKVR